MKPRVVVPVALLALAALTGPTVSSAAPTPITVTMTEMKFTFAKAFAKRGTIVFRLANKGAVVHDLRIAGKRSPRIAPGKTVAWRVTIAKPGRYAAICTVPGHASAGMKSVFRVT